MNSAWLMVLPVLVIAGAAAMAETAEEKGLRIALEAEAQDEGFHSYTALGNMILRDRKGKESARDFLAKTLEVQDDGDKSLMIFDRPRDIRDTALLTYSHKVGDDDQWLYLPALRRVKRISSNNQSGSFVGSEFSYEDLVSPEPEKYDHVWLRDEACPGAPELVCHVNQRYPTNKDSGYSRQVVWLDQEYYRVYRVEYFDRKNAHLKTLEVTDQNQYEDRYWRPGHLLMTNHQNGKSTLMLWRDYDFKANLAVNDFTKRALERIR